MDAEIDNMCHFNVFREVPRPKDKNIITARWVCQYKFENGQLVKRKGRIVARGFTQVSGVYYNEAHHYSPVMRLEVFCALTRSALYMTPASSMDQQRISTRTSPGYENREMVWKLRKGLYGLKQAGRAWHERLKADMGELGYTQCPKPERVARAG
jgi:Reverse transcriptase (RNA-dependent DNA polymerase)